MSEHNEPLSIIDVDYTSLDSLLASSQWQKADEETAAVMLKIACRVQLDGSEKKTLKISLV